MKDKIMVVNKVLVYIFLITLFSSCVGCMKVRKPKMEIKRIEIYCWCLVEPSLTASFKMNQMSCTTTVNLSPENLITKAHYRASIVEKDKLNKFKQIINKSDSVYGVSQLDVRLCLVLDYGEGFPHDTLSFISKNKLGLNSDKILIFNDADISSEIVSLLGGREIVCM